MKNIIRRIAVALITVVLLSCSICAIAADPVSDRGEYAEIIVESFFSGNADAAFDTTFGMSRPEFESMYNEALDYLEGAEEYRMIFADTFETVVSGAVTEAAIYVLETDVGVFEVDIALDGMYNKVGLICIYPAGDGWLDADEFSRYVTVTSEVNEPRELTRRGFHYTPLDEAAVENQYNVAFVVLYIVMLAFAIIMLIDCIRRPMKNKWVWILVILALSITSGRVMLPVGAMVYFFLRKRLSAE